MRKKSRKSIWNYIITALLMVVLLVAGMLVLGSCFADKIRKAYEQQMKQQDELIRNSTKKVYIALCEIHAGEPITENMVEIQEVLCTQDVSLLFTEEDIGKEAVVNVGQGTYLVKSLVNHSGKVAGLREMCYQTIRLTESIENYDVVDIRIRYPNGEDYIVLSGKTIRLDEGVFGKCYLQLSEKEILMMSSAMYDAELYRGTELYTSRYIEPRIQARSVVTYLPCSEMRELILASPNVTGTILENIQERKDLEVRLERKRKEVFYE